MNLHYKKEYSEVLRNGIKKHTIRKKEIVIGKILKHIIYPYQPNKRECVLENKCISVQQIKITDAYYINDCKVYIDGRLLSLEEQQQLAWNDGFPSLLAFFLYFKEPFEGYIIHFTDLRY